MSAIPGGSEHAEQCAVVEWARLQRGSLPELALLYACPNGGARHPVVGRKLKAEGVRAGVPDLCLPVARGVHHGLYVEMKAKGGSLTPEQRWWRDALVAKGYRHETAVGAGAAIAALREYLEVAP